MDREEVIGMARQAASTHYLSGPLHNELTANAWSEVFERFASLVIERCAKECEEFTHKSDRETAKAIAESLRDLKVTSQP